MADKLQEAKDWFARQLANIDPQENRESYISYIVTSLIMQLDYRAQLAVEWHNAYHNLKNGIGEIIGDRTCGWENRDNMCPSCWGIIERLTPLLNEEDGSDDAETNG